jgi:hypothetical protein
MECANATKPHRKFGEPGTPYRARAQATASSWENSQRQRIQEFVTFVKARSIYPQEDLAGL